MTFASLPTQFVWAAAAFAAAMACLLYFVSRRPSPRKALWGGGAIVLVGLVASHEGPASFSSLPADASAFLTNGMLVMASIGGNLIAAAAIMNYQAPRSKSFVEAPEPGPIHLSQPEADLSPGGGVAAAEIMKLRHQALARPPAPAASPALPLQLLATASLLLVLGAFIYRSGDAEVKFPGRRE